MLLKVDDKTYLKLFYDCVTVKGYTRSIICDLNRQHFDFIPNSLYFILEEFENKSLKSVFDHFDIEDHSTLIEYFSFLYDKEYIFWCTDEELKCFPNEKPRFETPAQIENCIVDVNSTSTHNWKKIIKELCELGCSNLQIRIFEKYDFDYCSSIFDLIENSIIRNVEILLPFCDEAGSKDFIKAFSKKYLRLNKLIVHSSPFEENYTVAETLASVSITPDVIDSDKCCGMVSPVFFTVDLDFFAESLKNNSCLNKKISVDASGYVKNCPSRIEHYGHLDTTSLKDALRNDAFLQKWKITKDDIEICKDCEFRHICPDCRAFKEHPEDEFSKPLKCNYDPYTGEWVEDKYSIPEFAKVAALYNFKNVVF
jgi:SPASM domain peptide maturase of grasp-with-spasm system